ncbi:MAG: SMP-30/gluconolactonase/LRE family protein [Rhodobacteraceae bacterium]|nr:SMP-30/gluconolactonase/LRE family protein [Paracoccaceae bacterium]
MNPCAVLIDHVTVGNILGESPLWLPDISEFLWLDLLGRRVHGYNPCQQRHRIVADGFQENLGCLVRLAGNSVLLMTATGPLRLDPENGLTEVVALPVVAGNGTCFNDGKVAPDGSLWLGTSDVDETRPIGALSRITGNWCEEVDSGFVISNGPAFSPHGNKAYFADSAGRKILQYTLDGSGKPLSRDVFANISEDGGLPDGLTVDSRGQVFSAHWQGHCVTVYGPDGQIRYRIPVPALNVTSCTFGGQDLSTLFVTSASIGTDGDSSTPEGDAFLFACNVKGVNEPVFKFHGD